MAAANAGASKLVRDVGRSRSPVWYPLFFAAFPVISIFGANASVSRVSDLWRPLAVSVAFGGLLWWIFSAVFRSRDRGAIAAAVVLFSIFYYSSVDRRVHYILGSGTLAVWIVLTAGAAILAARRWKWHSGLNVFSLCLLAVSAVTSFTAYGRVQNRLSKGWDSPELTSSESNPDIYYIVLDGYGRADQVERAIGLDNSSFIESLNARGFYVADRCHSNYVQTELSVASSLNMKFVQSMLPDLGARDGDLSELDWLASNGEVEDYLDERGYEIDAVTTGFPSFAFNSADRRLGRRPAFSLLEITLLNRTPFSNLPNIFTSPMDDRRRTLLAAFDELHRIGTAPKHTPKFVIAHILAPHPPFVFQADGTLPPWRHGYEISDGSDYLDHIGSASEYKAGYAGQAQFVNKQVIALIDAILANGGPRPIILIQGDHGSKLHTDMNVLAKTDVEESMSNLMAFLVPDNVRDGLYPTITPVNSFRIILSRLFGLKVQQLPDSSWYSPYSHPYDFTDVTERLRLADVDALGTSPQAQDKKPNADALSSGVTRSSRVTMTRWSPQSFQSLLPKSPPAH